MVPSHEGLPFRHTVFRMRHSYERQTLHNDGKVEVVRIVWKPGDESPVHEHGDCAGMVFVSEGRVEETQYRKAGGKVVAKRINRYREGDCLHERSLGIHKISSREGAVTIHVYSPPAVNKEITL